MAPNGPRFSITTTGVTTATSGNTNRSGITSATAAIASTMCTAIQATASAGKRRNDALITSGVLGRRSAYQPATSAATAPVTSASSSPDTANRRIVETFTSVS